MTDTPIGVDVAAAVVHLRRLGITVHARQLRVWITRAGLKPLVRAGRRSLYDLRALIALGERYRRPRCHVDAKRIE